MSTVYIVNALWRSDGEKFRPVMTCGCGAEFLGASWMEIGAMLDEHLEAHENGSLKYEGESPKGNWTQ